MSRFFEAEQVISQVLNEQQPLSIAQLASRFGIKEMLTVTKDTTFMASLLYYFGVLTFGGHTETGKLILKIPNFVVQKLYVERIQEIFLPEVTIKEEAQRVVEQFYQTGNIQPLCQFMEQNYFKVFDSRDYRWTNELTVKTAFLTLLFNDTFYIMDSENALGRAHADLTMIVRPDMRQYQLSDFMIEFKYVSLKKAGLTAEEAKQKTISELKALESVKNELAEYKKQLNKYRQSLLSRYGNKLRLRTVSVVAVGYERLVNE